jgi:hypothetical protein
MKKLTIVLILATFALNLKAQKMVSLNVGYVIDVAPVKADLAPRLPKDNKGKSVSLNIEMPIKSHLGLDFGLEYSQMTTSTLICGIISCEQFYTNYNRGSFKLGVYGIPFSKNNFVWKVATQANILKDNPQVYFIDGTNNPEPLQVGLLLKNTFQYNLGKKIVFNFSQSYDCNTFFNTKNDRFNVNMGMGYKF